MDNSAKHERKGEFKDSGLALDNVGDMLTLARTVSGKEGLVQMKVGLPEAEAMSEQRVKK